MANRRDLLREPGIVNAYVRAALDTPGNGLKSLELRGPKFTGQQEHQAVSLVAAELVPMRASKNPRVSMEKELITAVRTPDDEVFGVVRVLVDPLGRNTNAGKLLTRFAVDDGEAAEVLGEIHSGDEGTVLIEYPPRSERGDADPDWAVSIGVNEGVGGCEIAVGHVGLGTTVVYRADPEAPVQFSEFPLEPKVWSGMPGPTLAALDRK